MLNMFKKSILNVKQSGKLNKSIESKVLSKIQKFKFSGSSHHSESEQEHSEHSEHSEHENSVHNHNVIQEFNQEGRQRIFQAKKDSFSIEEMLNNAKKPLFTPEKNYPEVKMFENNEDYIKFLAETFEKKTLEKYPEYKKDLQQYIHRIPDFDKMNAYQKEVFTLDAYLHWKLETTEDDIRNAYDFKGTTLEQARERFQFFESKKKLYKNFLYIKHISDFVVN